MINQIPLMYFYRKIYMNWQTSIRVKDDAGIEHILLVRTSIPVAEQAGIVDIFINELDSNGNKKAFWDMRYSFYKSNVMFPMHSEFAENVAKEMQTLVDMKVEEW